MGFFICLRLCGLEASGSGPMTDKLVTLVTEAFEQLPGLPFDYPEDTKEILTQLAEEAYKLGLENERKRCTAECRFYKESADLKAEGE